MCQSKAEGGQRCAAHTSEAVSRALADHNDAKQELRSGGADRTGQTNDTLTKALVEYASTAEGERELRKRMKSPLTEAHDRKSLQAVLRAGWSLRETRRAEAQRLLSARVKPRAEAVRNATTPFTPDSIDAMTRREEWAGFGYLGERRNALEIAEPHEIEATKNAIREADNKAIAAANAASLTYEEFFTWANSKQGRWYGETAISSPDDRFTKQYLPQPTTSRPEHQWFSQNHIDIGYPKPDVVKALSARYSELPTEYCESFVLKDQPDVISHAKLKAILQSLDADQKVWDAEHGTETPLKGSGFPKNLGITRAAFVEALAKRHDLPIPEVDSWADQNLPDGDWLTTDTANLEGVTARFDNEVKKD